MQFVITMVIVIIGIAAFGYLYEVRSFRRNLRMKLRGEYGQSPDPKGNSSDYKGAAIYYNLFKKDFPDDELVDEITWEDLEMDRIFSRMNGTVSCAGEQLLYMWLHWLPKDKRLLLKRDTISRNI